VYDPELVFGDASPTIPLLPSPAPFSFGRAVSGPAIPCAFAGVPRAGFEGVFA